MKNNCATNTIKSKLDSIVGTELIICLGGDSQMENIQYYSPTELILNNQSHKQAGEFIKKYSSNVLIVLGGNFIKDSIWYSEVLSSLDDSGITYFELDDIQPNPNLLPVRKGIKVVNNNDIGFILSIGGGSAIDTAKTIAAGAKMEEDVWNLFTGESTLENALPVGTIMTIMSTGSEGSNGAVISNEATNEKLDVMSDKLRPVFCLMNPLITMSLPIHQVWAGITDMFSHVLERYLSPSTHTTLTDKLGEAIMKTIIHEAGVLENDFMNYEARANLMVASILAHNNLVGLDRSQEWTAHTIAAPLSGEYGITHADTISVILPQWAKYVYKESPEPFKKLAMNVFDVAEGDDLSVAKLGIEKLTQFFASLTMPLTLSELQITNDEKFEKMSHASMYYGSLGNLKTLEREDVLNIYHNAK